MSVAISRQRGWEERPPAGRRPFVSLTFVFVFNVVFSLRGEKWIAARGGDATAKC